MAFTPSSTIYLCQVPFDNTYKNQVYFSSASQQREYFSLMVKKTFSNYLTVRECLPDGGTRSIVRVEANIDELRSLGVNYMYYQNANHGTKYFYAFVTELIYVNDGLTKLVVETDVYQTWLFDVTLLRSFVVREHSETDRIGDNLVPEKFDIKDYTYSALQKAGVLDTFGYLIGSSAGRTEEDETSRGRLNSGIYQGLYFYYFESPNEVNSCLNDIEGRKGESVQFITFIPKMCLGTASVADNGLVGSTTNPAERTISVAIEEANYSFDGYTPKNNKLFTAPFFQIMVTNHNGEQGLYPIEDFENREAIKFKLYGDISASPSVTLMPMSYKGVGYLNDFGISISAFPQCSFNSDTFKLWLAKNSAVLKEKAASAVTTAGMMALPALLALAGGPAGLAVAGAGSALTAGQAMSLMGAGAHLSNTIFGTIAQVESASHEPNRAVMGNTSTNLLTAIEQNDFDIMIQRIKKHYAQTLDDYFTMFGYQTNRVKVPNVSSRPRFNYVQTQGVNIVGGIPNDDMQVLKAIYDNGVTLWKPYVTMCDYSKDNSPDAIVG